MTKTKSSRVGFWPGTQPVRPQGHVPELLPGEVAAVGTRTSLEKTTAVPTGRKHRQEWETLRARGNLHTGQQRVRRDRDGQGGKPVLEMYPMRILPTAGRRSPTAIRTRAVSPGINKAAAPHSATVDKQRYKVTHRLSTPGFPSEE